MTDEKAIAFAEGYKSRIMTARFLENPHIRTDKDNLAIRWAQGWLAADAERKMEFRDDQIDAIFVMLIKLRKKLGVRS